MKKTNWLLPAMMFLMTLVAVIILNARDIVPADMVHKTQASDVVSISQPQAISQLENNIEAFNACVYSESAPAPEGVVRIARENGAVKFIIDEKFGKYTQYLVNGDAGEAYDTKSAEGFNLAGYRFALFGNWTYCVDYIKDITFSGVYKDRIISRLGKDKAVKDDGFEFVLMSKELCGQPAEKSKSKYVVKARVLLESGEILTGYLDPKTKLFIGFEK
jgi:hypothetical protein